MKVSLTLTAQEARELRDHLLGSEWPTFQALGFQVRRQVEAFENRADWSETGVPYPPRRSLRPFGKKAKKDRDELRSAGEIVMRRAAHCCEVCHVPTKLSIHHRKRRSQGGSNDPVNLLAVCEDCHRHIHDNPGWGRDHGYLLRSTDQEVAR